MKLYIVKLHEKHILFNLFENQLTLYRFYLNFILIRTYLTKQTTFLVKKHDTAKRIINSLKLEGLKGRQLTTDLISSL